MSRKRLSPEDRALWDRVRHSASPLSRAERNRAGPGQGGAGALRPSAPPPGAPPARPQAPIAPFRIGQSAQHRGPSSALMTPAAAPTAPPRMDAKTFRQIKRGRRRPEAKLDLHGMTLDEGEGALRRFVYDAAADGLRLLLVVTGKGRGGAWADDDPIPTRRGALRRQLPLWLSRPPLGALVLEVTEAHATHGGSGAFYVYLRRRG
jgi:DNA-nicking Smr family endonuclease